MFSLGVGLRVAVELLLVADIVLPVSVNPSLNLEVSLPTLVLADTPAD